MKKIGQYIIKSCEKAENGTKLTLVDLEGNEISGTYNLGNLSFEQMQKLVGQQISCTQENDSLNVHTAWKGKKPTFCDKEDAAKDLII